jgi:hypothetical protein
MIPFFPPRDRLAALGHVPDGGTESSIPSGPEQNDQAIASKDQEETNPPEAVDTHSHAVEA